VSPAIKVLTRAHRTMVVAWTLGAGLSRARAAPVLGRCGRQRCVEVRATEIQTA
jgi:hypothetical protein